MRPNLSIAFLASSCALLAACGATPGTLAPSKSQANCVAAAARYYKTTEDSFRVDGSSPSSTDMSYDVRLTNTATGVRSRCTVGENGNVSEVITLR